MNAQPIHSVLKAYLAGMLSPVFRVNLGEV